MPSPITGGSSHHTRASTRVVLTKMKTEEELKKQADPSVKDSITAIDFLMDGDFKSKDNKMSFELLVLSCRTLIRKGLFGLIPITRLLASAYVLHLLTTHSASI